MSSSEHTGVTNRPREMSVLSRFSLQEIGDVRKIKHGVRIAFKIQGSI